MHTYIHKYIHTYLHTYIPTYIHTYLPTYLHTYIHTYIHTCMRPSMHYITLHCIALHYIALQYLTLQHFKIIHTYMSCEAETGMRSHRALTRPRGLCLLSGCSLAYVKQAMHKPSDLQNIRPITEAARPSRQNTRSTSCRTWPDRRSLDSRPERKPCKKILGPPPSATN